MNESYPAREDLVRRVTHLEELHAHQQHLLEQLNEVVVALRDSLTSIEVKLAAHQGQLKTLFADQSNIENDPNERPPHY